MMAPTRTAKFMKPMLWLEKLYGGAAKFWDWVRLSVRKELADQDTTKAENSTMGKRKSFHGMKRSRAILLKGCAFGWNGIHCCLEGVPFPRYGSRSAVAVTERSCAAWSATVSAVLLEANFSGSLPSRFSDATFSSEEVVVLAKSLGWTRCHFVSGKRKIKRMKMTACRATLSHQKFRQLLWYAMGPDMIGPTW